MGKIFKVDRDRELYVDFSDVQMIVFELNESGIWIHNHVNPLYSSGKSTGDFR